MISGSASYTSTTGLVNVPPVTVADVGINRPTNNITKSIYKFTLGSSVFQIGPTPPADQFQNQNTFNFVDTVSWVRGTHVFRFGGDYTRIILDKLFPQTFNGQLFFVNSPGSRELPEDSRISRRFSPVKWTPVSAAAAFSITSTATTISGSSFRMTGKCGRI